MLENCPHCIRFRLFPQPVTLPETVARGELRPLRDPMTARDDDG